MKAAGIISARSRLSVPAKMPVLPPRAIWTLVGASAIPIWATWPLLATLTASEMPLFQYLAILFAAGAATLIVLRRGVLIPQSAPGSGLQGSVWAAALLVAMGLFLSDILFLLALREIPAAEANLILYLWPLMVVGLASVFRLVRLRFLHLLAMGLGLAGAVLVLGGQPESLSLTGAALAFGGGAAWAAYVVFRMWQGRAAPDALGLGLALSAGLSVCLHLAFEDWVMPQPLTLFGTVLVGVLPLALGNLMWDLGARRGDKVTLATLAYATPLVSALLLTAAGFATPSIGLVLGGALIVFGGYLSSRAG